MLMTFMVTLLVLGLALGKTGQPTPDTDSATTLNPICPYDTPGRVAQCAGSKLMDASATNAEFVEALRRAIHMLPASSTYWSAAIITGEEWGLVAAKQTNFAFDASYGTAGALTDASWHFYDFEDSLDGPVVLFSDSILGHAPVSRVRLPSGSASVKPILQGEVKPGDGCASFNLANDPGWAKFNVAVVYPARMRCETVHPGYHMVDEMSVRSDRVSYGKTVTVWKRNPDGKSRRQRQPVDFRKREL